jgi:hypothetical protein
VRAASWFHDGSAIGAHPVAYGNNWVILGIVVSLPFLSRPVCLPVLARLVVKNTTSASRLYLARAMIEALAGALPGRTIHGVGDAATVQAAVITCLWYSVFGPRTVQVILIRDKSAAGYDLALVTTDLGAPAGQVIERYAARWSIEVANEDAKQIFGAGDARNRKAGAVRRTVPFTLACQTLTTLWYTTAGHNDADIAARREQAPWYTSKTQPSTADMIAKLRRVLITTKYRPSRPDHPTPAEIHVLRLAWETSSMIT